MPSRSLGRASLLLLGSTWAHSGLSLVGSILIGRMLGAEAVGAIALNLGLAGLVMAALLPGFARAHLKRLAEGQDTGRCLGTMTALQGALAVVLLTVLALVWAGETFVGPSTDTGVFLFLLAAQVTGRFSEAFLSVFIAREWVVAHGAIIVGARLTRLVAIGAVLVWAPRVAWVAATFWLESVVACAAAAALLAAWGVRVVAPTRASVRGYWTYARPFLVTTPIALVQDSIDRVLVGRWAGLAAAGYYHVARGLWEALASVMAPPGLLMFTRLSSLYAERSDEGDRRARTLFFSGLDKLLFVSTTLAFGFWAFAGWLIEAFYGPGFAPAATALRILVLAALAATVVNPYTFVLQAQDEVARFVPVNVLRLVVYLAALAILVPGRWLPGLPAGEAGAAAARLLLILFPAWVYVAWTRELAGIPFYRRAIVYVAGFVLGVLGFHAVQALVGEAVAPALTVDVLAATGGFAIYAAVLWWLHPGTRDNIAYAWALLLPRRSR